MRRYLRIAAGGGAASMVLVACTFLFVLPTGAAAQDGGPDPVVTSWVETYLTVGGAGAWLIVMAGLGCVVCTLAGMAQARAPGRWPHWRGLVLGLGEAAFLMGIFFSFQGLISAFRIIARLGAAVTPSDMADGLSVAMVDIVLGAFVALVALGGAGLIRLREPSATDPRAAAF